MFPGRPMALWKASSLSWYCCTAPVLSTELDSGPWWTRYAEGELSDGKDTEGSLLRTDGSGRPEQCCSGTG
jgi:hypothetical protein